MPDVSAASVAATTRPALTVDQVAERLGTSRWTVYRAIADESLAAIRQTRQPGQVGRKTVRVTEEALAAYIAANIEGGDTSKLAVRDDGLISFAEAARITGLSLETLIRGAKAGKFAHLAFGDKHKKRKFTSEQFAAFLAQHTVAAAEPAEQVDADLAAERARAQRAGRRRTAA